jgi:hypothetical protein
MDHARKGNWTGDATMRYLNAFPLPRTFTWPHRDDGKDRSVAPAHGTVTAYGKWLRETPYFPGLFELAHDILASAPEEFDAEWLPLELLNARKKFSDHPGRDGEHLAHKIRRHLSAAHQPTLF